MRIIKLNYGAYFCSSSAVGGCAEGEGPLGDKFDLIDPTDRFGQSTWELAEAELGRVSLNIALEKAGLSHEDIDVLVSGDLQNQCVASSVGLDSFGIPHLGIYGACSTLTEGLLIGSMVLNLGDISRVACLTTSHNLAAERQFRSPTEYGGQRSPSAQWTATAGGSFILTRNKDEIGKRPYPVTHRAVVRDVMVGRMIDGATQDSSNMGAAMSFAAADSILSYFEESEVPPRDFDLILTGDLGSVGSALLTDILGEKLPSAVARHNDCGLLIYDRNRQDVHAGGSGCGTSASVFAAHILPMLERGEITNMLLLSTGALMSQSSVLQGNTIRGIAPVLHIEAEKIEEKGDNL